MARGVFALSCARLSGKSVMPRRRKPAGPTSPPHTSEMSEPAQLIHLEILRPAKGQRCSKGAALERSTGCATSRREPEKAKREATAVHAESDSSRSRGITRPTFWSITTGFACRRGSRPEGRPSPDQEDAWQVKRLPWGREERARVSLGRHGRVRQAVCLRAAGYSRSSKRPSGASSLRSLRRLATSAQRRSRAAAVSALSGSSSRWRR